MYKTKFILFGSAHNIKLHSSDHLTVGHSRVMASSSVSNLGVHMDSTLSMNNHVSHMCKTLIFQLRNISRIRRYLDIDSCNHIVLALVISRLDYGNYLLTGTTETNINKLQRIQNRAVRLICGSKRCDHVSPYRAVLHWLPVKELINFKLLTIIYQCVHD